MLSRRSLSHRPSASFCARLTTPLLLAVLADLSSHHGCVDGVDCIYGEIAPRPACPSPCCARKPRCSSAAVENGGWSVVLPPFLLRPCLRSSSLVSISLVAPSCCRPLRGAIPVRFWPSTVSAAAVWCDREMDRCSRRRRRVAGKEMANGDMQRTKRVSIAGPETCERRGNGRYRYGSTIHNSFTTDVHVIRTPF